MSRELRNTILVGDVRQRMSEIAANSIDCVITSPPYFQLRNYREPDQIGLERAVGEWVENLRAVLVEIARVLKPSGSVWLNVGDTHSGHVREGALPKSLLLGPERLGLALIADGWLIRNKIVWAKRNPLPSSARDRLACTWELVYLLTRSPTYFFDLDAIRVPHGSAAPRAHAPLPFTHRGATAPLDGRASRRAATGVWLRCVAAEWLDIRSARTRATSGPCQRPRSAVRISRPSRSTSSSDHCWAAVPRESAPAADGRGSAVPSERLASLPFAANLPGRATANAAGSPVSSSIRSWGPAPSHWWRSSTGAIG
jgi:hypothetical protein